MNFLAPWGLLSLVAVPVLAGAYLVMIRQRATGTGLSMVTSGDHRPVSGRRRHIPFAIFLAAIAVLLVGFARPEMDITLPVRTGKVILAFDTSNSMVADDAEPTRIDAAKQTALDLLADRPGSIQIGVVAFTNGGLVVQEPTKNELDVAAAIDRLSTDGGTSIGEGIFAALDAISDTPIEVDLEVAARDITALDIGFFSNAVIVLFTDGEDIGGANPLELAGLASNSGVRIHTVGVGSERGTVVDLDGFSIATALDEPMLTEIASSTGGTYFAAANDVDMASIFDDIERRFEQQGETIEITGIVAMIGIALLLLAGGLSLRWFGRVP